MKQSLQLKLSQHLTLTPQLQQSIRLLQLSTVELNQEMETFIQSNPLLERADDDWDEGSSGPVGESYENRTETTPEPAAEEREPSALDSFEEGSWWAEGAGRGGRDDDDDEDDARQVMAETQTLRQHLNWQLNLLPLSDRDKIIVSLLIDALDDDGYLTMSVEELLAILPPELEVEEIEVLTALKHLQNFDPPGVGARNLSECLVLQMETLPEDTPYRDQAFQIARHHLDALASRDYASLKKTLKCDDDTLRGAQQLITHLNPRPGGDFAPVDTRYVVPDVVVKKLKGVWTVSLNSDAMPRLRVNRLYADILSRNRDASHSQLSAQLQEAKWLIKNIQQRFDTILRVSQAIVDRQRHFFDHGEVAMRPLVLREIADAVGLHESTVSRVTTQKFMATPRGVYELKYFFGSHVATETGGACSATAIRALIKQLVGAENPKKPLSDSEITKLLADQGIVVARRTIAKYRESMQIPPVNLRKSI
ncbi:MAG: RNA polymerase factor sigma-54 [Sulfuricellaceae bacterium]|jgi:RNA polymerase sigma-54 factor